MSNRLLERMAYRVLILIVPLLLISGCEQNKQDIGYYTTDYEVLCKMVKDVNVSDGVNQKEAEVLADTYYRCFATIACGGVFPSVDMQNYWDVPVAIGIAGQPYGSIKIDKKTARMTWEHGPTIEDPVKYFCSKCDK
jgi:hypothetical protein